LIYRFAIAVLIALAAASQSAAELKIVGPSSIPVGGMALIKLEGATRGEPFDFFVAPTTSTLVVLFDIDETPVGVFNGQRAESVTIIGVSYDAETKKITRALHTLTVGKPSPEPQPDPQPDPEPKPQPTGPLAKQMESWLATLKGKVTKQILGDLASNYEGIAAQAVAIQGTMTKDGFVAATQTENVRVLGPQLALEMRDPFFVPLAKFMNERKLGVNDEAGHAALWREVAAALNEVAKSW
jgi:hypothetical protein